MDDNKNETKYLSYLVYSLIYEDVILHVFKNFLKIEISVVRRIWIWLNLIKYLQVQAFEFMQYAI